MKSTSKTGIIHNDTPAALNFQVGSTSSTPGINGYYGGYEYNYEQNVWDSSENVETYLEEHEMPDDEPDCSCGGPIMTAEHDFSEATESYDVSWDTHLRP